MTAHWPTQILAPYVAASFGRVYPGGMPLLDVIAANQPLLELMSSWETPPTLPITSKSVAFPLPLLNAQIQAIVHSLACLHK